MKKNRKIYLTEEMDTFHNPHWIISGDEQNLKYALQYNQIWGLQDKWFPHWKSLEKGDIIFFYITKVKSIVGVGRVENKFIQREPLWPDEIEENKVKYPLRFEFTLHYLVNKKQWKTGGINNLTDFVGTNFGKGAYADLLRGGVNFIRYKKVIKFLYEQFEKKLNYKIPFSKTTFFEEKKIEEISGEYKSLHKELQELIYKIGEMNKFLSAKEYIMNDERLDVVWRRVDKGSPTYVFEVQVGGDIYHALGKLKHAFDIWNSNIFLIVASEKDISKSINLLDGTFHEIKNKIKIISKEKIEELYRRKISWIEYERKLGIL